VEKQISETLVAYGVLDPDPAQLLSLSLAHAGRVNRVWVHLGQRVKKGSPLLQLISAPDARRQYLQAQSALDFARRELARKQRLLSEQLATKTQLDAAHKALRDAKASLNALHKRGLNRSEEILYAPMDGIITQLDVTQGQRLQANARAMLIAAEKHLIARLGVEPEDLARLIPGTPVTISLVFMPEVKVESRISELHAMLNPRTHLVAVLAPIPNSPIDHWPLGSRIIGRIHLPPHSALVVPRSAVLNDKQGAFVYTIRQGKAQRINLQTDLQQADAIEIISSLKAGDNVISMGNYELRNGMAIRETHE
ncbi:MAG: efflux RND transporter periplasmic adaptor subunit, partial [Gammaproteobacteria bacterium]|nr:efflux RND transporter periplasmic adaptor subunit [Gammaproteobacteria bacterium]